ncbi:phosphoenolpyruvate carboxykinase [ATP] [Aureimonas ureilytica]|uniref:Phosphoenolpyruvate carboxykinase (ATP) n=1 Tax=Aureimonas ureilytica TaxID=401562 RepID=A0A175RSV6_9HYPH|nr:phosphoenolpyruvate carboxykinase [Aureimonas ureilytica]KTR06810.1 phosphoenolpyruvate carboxykinase [ATP] [Aureimonas ureilytica]
MEETGIRNSRIGIESTGLSGLSSLRWNAGEAELVETALQRGEGRLTAHGALVVTTGQHTGRSPKDKFVVRDETTDPRVWWDNNKPMDPAAFERLYEDFKAQAAGRDLFVQDLVGGADEANAIRARVVTEFAWHSLFIRNLLIRPTAEELESFVPELTIIDLPSFKADPERHGCRTETVIACDFTRNIILIGGTTYAGEMKKSVFTVLNYRLPETGVMPMHCSANIGANGDTAVFFGLSGTGKTTLSADPRRTLIGDDEHGWGEDGVFNFEGGCYAKTIRLSAEAEPEIFATTRMFGTVLENVILDENRVPNFDDGSLTENTRAAYPLHFIPNASDTGRGAHPKNIIMLTADAFGVMPPIAKLSPAEAMYHFLSGYTAKVAGTEKGVTEPEATFSTCFGAPFMPRHPAEYGNLLRDLIARHEVDCWLVSTGWTGGAYGTGRRMPIKVTRTLLNAALDGSLKNAEFRTDPHFGFQVPVAVPGVETAILDPRSTWADGVAYDAQARKLADMFRRNFEKFEAHVDGSVLGAAPASLPLAAE